MPRNWDQEYHQKIHRRNVKQAKGKLQTGAGGGRRAGKHKAGGTFAEQGDALQASLEASSALIEQLKEKVGMTDAQRDALSELEENADSLHELFRANAVSPRNKLDC